jgi:ADP-heptose:LPS heptosyltransferase
MPVHAKAPAASSVLGGAGLIHSYIDYSVGSRNILELAKLWWKIRRLGVKTIVYLSLPRGEAAIKRDVMFFRLCGAKEIIGIPYGELGTHLYDGVAGRYESEATRLARCVSAIGDARLNESASWDLLLTEKEHSSAMSALRPIGRAAFLALGIASKKSVTDWGIENWKALMPELCREFPGHALVLLGAAEDRAAAETVAVCWEGRVLNLSGHLSPRESAAVIQRGDLFIGLDSGPMHLAASVGTPCVSIFSAHTVPGMWFPFGEGHEVIYHKTDCYGCNLVDCTHLEKKCILSISVNEVVAAAIRARERKQAAAQFQRL